jgi:hypothetical protein
LKASFNGDLCGFEPNEDNEVREKEVICRLQPLLQAVPQLRSFHVGLSHLDSDLNFVRRPEDEDEEKDVCKDKLKSAMKIKELCPMMERFRYSHPEVLKSSLLVKFLFNSIF